MQNKSNKLPYVFVEIDEIEDQDDLDLYGQSAGAAYQPIPGAQFPPNMSGPLFPQMTNPYAPPIGPLAALQMTPQFQVGPYAQSLDMLDVEPDDDYLDDDYDMDDFEEDDLEGDIETDSDESSAHEASKTAKGASEEETLNLETVVIPVFKNADFGQAGDRSQMIAQAAAAYPQFPVLPTTPFMQTLPYSYNPFRTPFVNPVWAQPRMSMLGPAEVMRLGAYSAGAQQAMQQRGQMAASASTQSMRQGAHPQNVAQGPNHPMRPHPVPHGPHSQSLPNQQQGANRSPMAAPRQRQANASPDSPVLPMEALEAFEGPRSTEVPLPSHAAQNIKAASARANVSTSVPDPVHAGPLEATSNEQTITASTDNVSVSVSVVQPKQPSQSDTSAIDSAASQPRPKPQPQGQAIAVEQPFHGSPSEGASQAKAPKAKKKASAPKAPKETFEEMAMRENAEKTHTSLTEFDGADQMGKPLLDMNAIETSDMFSTPAASMNDSMTGFQFRASRRKHVLMIVLAALILAIVIAAVVCVVAVWTGAATIAFDESNVPSIQLAQAFEPK